MESGGGNHLFVASPRIPLFSDLDRSLLTIESVHQSRVIQTRKVILTILSFTFTGTITITMITTVITDDLMIVRGRVSEESFRSAPSDFLRSEYGRCRSDDQNRGTRPSLRS